MLKTKKESGLNPTLVLSLSSFLVAFFLFSNCGMVLATYVPAVSFTADTTLGLDGMNQTAYIASGSTCNSMTTSGTDMTVNTVNGDYFALKTSSNGVLSITPGGTASLNFSSNNFSNGYVGQWTETSSSSVVHTVGVPSANTNYCIKADGTDITGDPFKSDSNGQITFTKTGSGVAQTYTVNPAPCVQGNGTVNNVYGWAWSENIGWISFNNNPYGTIPGGGGTNNYGVNIGTNGQLSGYAWSENIGWIDFGPSGPYPASPSHHACVNLPGFGAYCDGSSATDYTVSGWARACSVFLSGCSGMLDPNRGGWDGWIILSNVSIDTSVSPAQFHSWLWGGSDDIYDTANNEAITGWGSFNCAEGGNCATYNYKVVTSFPFHPSNPTIGTVQPLNYDYCSSAKAGTVNFSWAYANADGNVETRYQLQVEDKATVDRDSGAFNSPETTRDLTNLSVADGGTNSQAVTISVPVDSKIGDIAFNNNYYWRIKVYDDQGNDSGWYYGGTSTTAPGTAFTTASHPWPSAAFSASPLSAPLINNADVVSFTDSSTCYNAYDSGTNDYSSYPCSCYNSDGSPYSCNSTQSSDTYKWWFDHAHKLSTDSTAKTNVTNSYAAPAGTHATQLEVCDNNGCCDATGSITVKPPLGIPGYKEISPF